MGEERVDVPVLQRMLQDTAFPGLPGFGIAAGVQQIELENFVEVVQGPLEGHHGEAGEFRVLRQVRLEGWQQVACFHEGIAVKFRKRLHQTELDMYKIEKATQFLQAAQGGFRQQLPVFQGSEPGDFGKGFGPVHVESPTISLCLLPLCVDYFACFVQPVNRIFRCAASLCQVLPPSRFITMSF